MLRSALALGLLFALPAHAADPLHTDGDKYKVRFENDRVRVLEYTDKPGDRTHQHRHPAFVLFAIAPFKRKLILPDGRELVREFKAGDVMWSDPQTHIGVNVGDTPTRGILIEMK
jgi:quercetin dioxygenase-like cupin family protein